MAAPPNITLKNLDGQWVLNRELSENYDPVLKLQGVNWLMRKVLGMATVTVIIKEWEEGGHTHIDVENRPNGGLPPTTENRVFNYESVEIAHPLFGNVRSQTRWASTAELDEVDGFLADGFEAEESEAGGAKPSYVHIMTEHLDQGVMTHQVWGFAQFNEQRYQTRHILVRKGEETSKVTLVYDYLGPRAADEP